MNRTLIKLLLPVVLLIAVLFSAFYGPQIDLKSGYFDGLNHTDFKQWLQQVPPLEIEVMASSEGRAGGYVANFLAPLQDYWNDLTIRFLDPAKYPEKIREYGIKARGEMVVHYNDDYFVLTNLSYETLFNGLQQLLNPGEGWFVILDGFNSQNLNSDTPDGLGLWLNTLQQLNYSVAALTWQPDMTLPSDVKAILLANPTKTLSDQYMQWLQQQLDRGVSLWWLSNPQSMVQQPHLSLLFDALPSETNLDEIAALDHYPNHAITQQFTYPTTWQGVVPFVSSGETVLQLNGQVFAATHTLKESRLLLVGDSDFINNSLINSGGNRALSLRMLDWLMHHDSRVNLPDLSAQQVGLLLTPQQVVMMSGLLLIGLPVLSLLIALLVWFNNSRQEDF